MISVPLKTKTRFSRGDGCAVWREEKNREQRRSGERGWEKGGRGRESARDCHDNGSVPRAECLQAASSIYRPCPFLPRPGEDPLSPSCRRFSRPPSHRNGGFREATGVGWCPGGFCPSFVSSSNYDLPHEYEPYVNIRSPSASLPLSPYSIVSPLLSLSLSPSTSRSLSLARSLSSRLSFFLRIASYRGADVISCSVGLQMHPR